jgi:hypothetical protein
MWIEFDNHHLDYNNKTDGSVFREIARTVHKQMVF